MYLCNAIEKSMRAFSSAGSEHLPYKQRVGGSNPSTPTTENQGVTENVAPFFVTRKLVGLIRLSRKFQWRSKKNHAKIVAKRNIKNGMSATPLN